MKRAVLLDTSVASTNIGDQIIMEAVRNELSLPLRDVFITSVASHETMGRKGRGLARAADLIVAGGSNLISSHMWARSVWRLTPLDAFIGMNVVLMGVGWYQFQSKPDPYTAWLLRKVLHPSACHSVRDGYTAKMLASIGIANCINTGCPTLWDLTPDRCAALPKRKSKTVVTTVNTYIKDVEADGAMVRLLREKYDAIFAWVQTAEDHAYLQRLGGDIQIIDPSLAAFDRLLSESGDIDYVGNRLHGGIRALQHGRRAIIVEIDNRATEMGRDFRLPTVARTDFDRMSAMIDGPLDIAVRPPLDAISQWKDSLRTALEESK